MKKKLSLVVVLIMLFAFAHNVSAASGYSFSVGTQFGSQPNDTSDEAEYAYNKLQSMGYTSYLLTQPTTSTLALSYAGNPLRYRLESDVVFLAGHANSNVVSWNYKGKGGQYAQAVINNDRLYSQGDYSYAGLGYYKMSRVDLMILLGCQTAKGTSNITQYVNSKGATTTVGWTDDVPQLYTGVWTRRFFDKLTQGATVSSAVSYANSFNYFDLRMTKTKIYGSSGATVNSASLSTMSLNRDSSNTIEELKEFKVNKSILLQTKIAGKDTISAINDIIKENVNNSFNSANFIVETSENDEGKLYIYYYTVNGIKTNVGYNVFANSNGTIINRIVDNMKDIDPTTIITLSTKMKASPTMEELETMRQKALTLPADVESNSFIRTIENEQKFYDIIEDKMYYVIEVKETDSLFNTSSIIHFMEEI